MTEREYDEIFNEGATDGFNPYRSERDPNAGEPMWSKIESRIAKIQRLLNGLSDNAFDAPRVAKLTAEKAELEAAYAKLR